MPQAVIIAGGKGTRLKDVLGDLPKPLAEVAGKSLLEHQIELARKHGFEDIVVLTGHGAEHIETRFGSQVRCLREPEPLGTAGAVLHAWDVLADRFAVLYGDTMLNVDLARMWASHPAEAAATLFLHPNDHPHDSDLVQVDSDGRVIAFHPYPHTPGEYLRNLVNAALYVVEKRALEPFRDSTSALDFGKQIFPQLLAAGSKINGYITREYIKDAGTPKRLERVRIDAESGRIASSSLSRPLPAIFFDRDGTLNDERSWISRCDQLELLPHAAEAVRMVNQRGWLSVVITNQAVIARGDCSEPELRLIHNKLEWLLGEQHAYLDAIYYCPHHPKSGFAGERPELKFACTCRKPQTGLVEQAVRDLNIDLSRSWFIGDRESDIGTAGRIGIRSVLVHTGYGLQASVNCTPTTEAATVLEAVRTILDLPENRLR